METTSRSPNSSVELAVNSVLTSPWLWGTGVTFVFYGSFPFLPVHPKLLERYFSAHWIEFVVTGLFFVGVCALFNRLKQILAERNAVLVEILNEWKSEPDCGEIDTATKIDVQLDSVAKKSGDTRLAKRVRDACQFVTSRRSADGLEGHLRYLAELAGSRLHTDYGLIRTLIWTVPILGFLGTVIRTTLAIGSITPERLESSFSLVTATIAVALDSTALSLALSTILVFIKLGLERSELRILENVEEFGFKRLPGLFAKESVSVTSPFGLAEKEAADQLLVRSEQMINWQMELWQSSLEALRERWSNSLSQQQVSIEQSLHAGLSNALAHHSQLLVESRSVFMTAFQKTSEFIGLQLAETRSALSEQQQKGSEQIVQTWQQFRAEITKTRDEHARQLALLTQAITAEVGGWQNQLESSTQTISLQFHELRTQGEVFLKLTENESELIRLESRLAENLDAIHVVESLENTLMSLNAAVNLLTSRVKSHAA